jgi:hypothetical protein
MSLAVTASAPEVALLCTQGESTELRFQRAGTEALASPVARFTHANGEEAKGALLPGTRTVVAIARTSKAKDASFASSLVRLSPGQSATALVDRVVYATRPLVTPEGRVFVSRGVPGPGRVDSLSIDEVNPKSGAAHSILHYDGFATFLSGAVDGEVLVYRVGPNGADLVAAQQDGLGVRTVLPHLVALARDFAIEGHTLYFTQAAARGEWVVMRVDTKTGESATVLHGADITLLPTLLPAGLAYSPGAAQGLRFLNGATALLPQGSGFERVQTVKGGWAVGLDEVPSQLPTAFAVELSTGRALNLAAPALSRIDIAGVSE